MIDSQRRRENLRAETAATAARCARQDAAARQERPPRPGDLYLATATAAFPLEWLVLTAGDAAPDALLLAVDDHPLLGSRDVEVASPGGGVARVRCGDTAEARIASFSPELRTGTLAEEEFERVRRKRAAVEAGTLQPSPAEEEADTDPEYRNWSARLSAARQALSGEEERPESAPRTAKLLVHPAAARRWPGERPERMAVAAAAVLFVLGGGLGWQTLQLRDAERQSRRLAGERQEQQRRIADLERDLAAERGPRANLYTLELSPGGDVVRGGEPERLPADVSGAYLTLEVPGVEDSAEYRVIFLDAESGEEIRRVAGLTRLEGAWLTLELRREDFPAGRGEYRLRVEGLQDGEWMPAVEEEYRTLAWE